MFTKDNTSDSTLFFNKLLRKIRKDPESGLDELYHIYGRLIYRIAKNICGKHDKAEEVVDLVLIKIQRFAQKRQKVTNPNGFIYIVTVNCTRDNVKEKKEVCLNEAISVGEDNIQKFIDRDAFESHISFLPEYERSIMIRKFNSEETFQEMADVDGKPLSTITTIYYRCLKKIKQNMEKNKKEL